MKALYLVSYALIFIFFTAFTTTEACEYAESNINFIKSQTEEALSKDDLNLSRYHAYKALNAIEKSKKQLKECGCDYATIGIEESSYLLKRATKANSLNDTKNLLKRSLINTEESLRAIVAHDVHKSKTSKDLLAINTQGDPLDEDGLPEDPETVLKRRIDTALEKYRKSLNKVVETVNCKEAKAFAERVYQQCEQELLVPDLSEGKKYYNLQTQKITAEALERIGTCASE